MTRFVILTTQRSGSTVLTRTLDEHPEIFCAGEIFHESKKGVHHPEWHFPNWKIIGGKGSKINKLINYPNLKLNAGKHLTRFYKDDGTAKAKGFKLMYSHIKNAPFIWDSLVASDIKAIVLIRRNTFRMALSRYRMEKTGTAHSKEGIQTSSITVSAKSLLEQTLLLQQVNDKLLTLSRQTDQITLYYEDFTDWSGVMQKTDAFLNVPFIDVKPVLKKVSANNWKDEVKNYKEIEDVFIQNNAESYLLQS